MSEQNSDESSAVARAAIRSLEASRIREVANSAFGKSDVLAFWFGESDQSTPEFIRHAAVKALHQERTFYTHNLGHIELRIAVCSYLNALHGSRLNLERVAIANSGVSALMIAMQALLDPGDRVVAVTPVWPNLVEIPNILGAQVIRSPLRPGPAGWALDLDQLLSALTPQTRLLLLNSPGNPTGWTLTPEHRTAVLEHCRKLGTWILADDVYERLIYSQGQVSAPSFLSLAEPEDRVISANSFSKAWLMTGWRLGWIVAPPMLMPELAKLLEYNTSCAPDFIQHAGVAALGRGEPHVLALRADLQAKRDRLLEALRSLPQIEAPDVAGGIYAFFKMANRSNSVELAKSLIDQAGLGLAPGAAFGLEGEGWLRWCFAASQAKLDAGVDRLIGFTGR